MRREETTAESIKAYGLQELNSLNDNGQIDPLSNFQTKERAVILISGLNDTVVPPKNQQGAFDTFQALGMNGIENDPDQNLKLVTKDIDHGWDFENTEEILSFLWEKLGYGELQ